MMKNQRTTPKFLQVFAVVAALLVGFTTPVSPAFADAAVKDGSAPANAAASCWEVKQTRPEAASGVYWLLTPAMQAPEQFYCDQETDGGGWVLIGRGREGWTQTYTGTGTTAAVRDVVTGPEAFRVAQLPARTVDALLNGSRVDQLADGVRLRRATNVGGTTWQESRFKYAKRDRWVWTPAAAHPIGTYRFDTVNGSGGSTNDFGRDNRFSRVDTRYYVNNQFRPAGWAYGSEARGSSDPSSYLWAENATIGSPRPFTQVFVRPKLTQASVTFTPVADGGTPVIQQSVLPQSGAERTSWGVTGLANGRATELDAEVQGFTQVGSTVFSVGNFRYVQRSAAGDGQVEQPYVAGFDVNTGEFVPTFRPVLNGQVKAAAALPNGLLVLAGEFTSVNGQSAPGIAALDPVTGKLSTTWTVRMENRLTGGTVSVRSLSVEGDYLYLGGAFTHLGGGTRPNPTYARGASRVSVLDGTPDQNWNPAFNGTVVSVDASNDQRLYAAGYFTLSNGQTANRVAAVRATPGQPASLAASWPFTGSAGDRANYQQAIRQVGDRVWVGGSEHSLFTFNTTTFARLSGNITLNGGDFQTMTESNGVVFAGCHCDDWSYSNAFTWSSVGSNWTQADKIGFVGAWDAASGAYVPDFAPVMQGRKGIGAWGLFSDSRGVLWIGGDFVSSLRTDGQNQWAGGFSRFAPRDASAPGSPTDLKAVTDGVSDTLTWTGAAGSSFEVLRNDRVVAITSSTTTVLPAAEQGSRYFVRAADPAGNRSASTSAVTPTVPTPDPVPEPDPEPEPEPEPDPETVPDPPVVLQPTELVVSGSEWRYRFENSAPDAAWASPTFDDSAWLAGAAPLGFGHSSVATTLTATGTKPLTAYYRRSFDIVDVTQIQQVELTSRADDGIVVYVNGTEVARANMPASTPTFGTYATSAPSTAAAPAVRVAVPASAFTNGKNVITTEVHSNYRSTPNSTMELTARATLRVAAVEGE